MANHSLIRVRKTVSIMDIEQAFEKFNQERFGGRLVLSSTPELTGAWQANRAWLVEAPGTRPEKPGPCNPDENLGFCFWLTKDHQIESRHNIWNRWISWVQDMFEHTMAAHFGAKKFDGGDGKIHTNAAKYNGTCREFYLDNYRLKAGEEPDQETLDWMQKRIFDDIPKGWE